MKKICLQAGHKGVYVGATGASGERDWTSKIVPLVATILRKNGCEVYECDSYANKNTNVINKDWDLFLAVHYDADIYNDTGGFADFPEPSTDLSTAESQRICKVIVENYFPMTGIKYMPNRRNANTKYYFMWKYLSAKTPCVILECGIGNRKPEDYNKLRNFDLISNAISTSIMKALGINPPTPQEPTTTPQNIKDCQLALQSAYSYITLLKQQIEEAIKQLQG